MIIRAALIRNVVFALKIPYSAPPEGGLKEVLSLPVVVVFKVASSVVVPFLLNVRVEPAAAVETTASK
jgi:hypothetical protein